MVYPSFQHRYQWQWPSGNLNQFVRTGFCRSSIAMLLWLTLGTVAAHAQESHFGRVALQPGFTTEEGNITGETGGTSSMAAISHYDTQTPQHLCSGYTQDITTPGHILELKSAFQQLTLQVNSRGQDTTLLVQGPNGRLYCGDDISELNQDAQVTATDLSPGTYRIWVGNAVPGEQQRYRLIVEETP
jgi:hypothetical protein